MSQLTFDGVNIYDTPLSAFFLGSLTAEDGVITSVSFSGPPSKDAPCLIPGLVDVHTHGRSGYDFISASPDELSVLRREYAAVGTTTVIPSLATATFERWLEASSRIKAAGFRGIHFEGRYLNPLRRGAHDPALLSPLDLGELALLLQRMRGGDEPFAIHFTVAPELENGRAFIEAAVAGGATVSAGHTDATYEQATASLDWGVTAFTHTFNAMSPIHHRKPGAVTASLLSDAYSEFICDGIHIAPAVIRLAWRAKEHSRFCLITDSMMAAGFGDGDFTLGGLKARVRGGVALCDDGTIAGSTADLYHCMLNLRDFAGASFEQAVACATINPARELGIDGVCASLEAGRGADICVIAPDTRTLVNVYANGEKIV